MNLYMVTPWLTVLLGGIFGERHGHLIKMVLYVLGLLDLAGATIDGRICQHLSVQNAFVVGVWDREQCLMRGRNVCEAV